MLQAETIIQSDSIKGWYLMDTGGCGTIDFTAQAVKQFQLDSIPGKRYITDMTQFGIGEKEQEYFVDMLSDQIIIGGDTINKECISYIPEGAGAFSSRPYIGVIGNGIWENYNIIIEIMDSETVQTSAVDGWCLGSPEMVMPLELGWNWAIPLWLSMGKTSALTLGTKKTILIKRPNILWISLAQMA